MADALLAGRRVAGRSSYGWITVAAFGRAVWNLCEAHKF